MGNKLENWTTFFNQQEFEEFDQSVRDTLLHMGLDAEIINETVKLSGKNSTYGLYNLAQACNGQPRRSWSKVIRKHFEALLKSEEDYEAMLKQAERFEHIKDLLAVRVYPADYELTTTHASWIIKKTDLEETITTLVIDLPKSIVNVQPNLIDKWGCSLPYLFSLGVSNVKRKYHTRWKKRSFGDIEAWTAYTKDFYASTRLFFLNDFPFTIGRYGSIVAVANRNTVIAYPIEDSKVVKAITNIASAAKYMYENNPGPVSTHLYWYHEGKFEILRCLVEGDNLNITPPDGLLNILDKLETEEGAMSSHNTKFPSLKKLLYSLNRKVKHLVKNKSL